MNSHKKKTKTAKPKSDLLTLQNVGPAVCRDLDLLGIHSIHELKNATADELYLRLEKIYHCRLNTCVWDVFAAITHEAKTGKKTPWWHWTPVRQKRQANGTFVHD